SVEAHRADLHTGNVIDAGESVMPGLIETHAHLNEGYGETLGRIFLAYGITTVRNPAANPMLRWKTASPWMPVFALGLVSSPRVTRLMGHASTTRAAAQCTTTNRWI